MYTCIDKVGLLFLRLLFLGNNCFIESQMIVCEFPNRDYYLIPGVLGQIYS